METDLFIIHQTHHIRIRFGLNYLQKFVLDLGLFTSRRLYIFEIRKQYHRRLLLTKSCIVLVEYQINRFNKEK